MSEPIEDYLDSLYPRLPRNPSRARRVLAETEAHLRDAADAAVAAGAERADAERAAVARFGTPTTVAPPPGARTVTAALGGLGMRLLSIGLLAVGASGLLALGMNAILGRSFVGGIATRASAATCRHVLAVQPSAHSCARALTLENADDAVSLRILAGLIGMLLLAAGLGWRHYRGRAAAMLVPPLASSAVGAAVFGSAAAVLIGESVSLASAGGRSGVGYYLSGGLAALAVAVGYGAGLLRELRAETVAA